MYLCKINEIIVGFLRRYKSVEYGNYRGAGAVAGLWSGGLLALYLVVRWLANVPVSAPQTYGSDIVLFLCMLLESYRYRKALPEEKVTLKELMQLNLYLAVVAAAIFGLFTWLYGTVMDDGFVSRCVDRLVAGEEAGSATPAEKQEAVRIMQGYGIGTLAWIAAFRSLVMSILWAFLASLLFRNEQGQVLGTGLFSSKRKKGRENAENGESANTPKPSKSPKNSRKSSSSQKQ